ncbi:HdeD family acid-resistance protein [Bordetella genomosp. 9]|uniref:HdeD family acid-resistance protein n=1 Tax=Bordetella genomosp. 9 TaxID=1416803 RepID=UPI001E653A46|nr:HdeD family acid-resistance protein [Bordetella genomosp. 9]
MSQPMDHAHLMGQAWWVLVIRGIVGILFGVLALMWPALTLLLLVSLFAAYALLSGIAAIAGAWRARRGGQPVRDGWLIVLLGLVAIASGVIAIVWPAITALALILIMGVNAIVAGVLDIALAVRHRTVVRNTWLMVLAGIVSILFGVVAIAVPGAGAMALVWLISFYAIVTGVLLLAMGIQARRGGPRPFDHAAA